MAQGAGISCVFCCKCGILIQPNAANMCAKCLVGSEDITKGLSKHQRLYHCPECDSYLQQPSSWVKLQLESKELLKFCLNKLQKNLSSNKVRMVHAEFIWTEPHSKRIEVKVKVQKEVLNGVIVEHSYVVEYVQLEHMCGSCSRIQASPDQCVATVQLRQHVSHPRTFFCLEQLIKIHGAATNVVRIGRMNQGIDFFFSNRNQGVDFAEFIGKVAPVRSRCDKRLVSHDPKSNNYNYRYTFSVEICPICREDLIVLPPKVAASLGNLGPLVICTKITNNIALLDPFTLRQYSLDADHYWRAPFKSLLTSRHLVEYIVLDVVVSSKVKISGKKYVLADCQVARVSDFGKNDTIFCIRTHLGHLLNPGDYALGYDLYGANYNDIELDKYKGLVLPDAVLIRKSFEEKCHDKGKLGQGKKNSEYEQFLKDLEENPHLRFDMSLTDGGEAPSLPLEELLADLDLSEEEDEDSMME